MMEDYKEVVMGYTRTVGEITEEQQRDLIKIFEKRVAAEETQIRHDYFDMKKADKGERMLAFVANPQQPSSRRDLDDMRLPFLQDMSVQHIHA